MKVIEILKTAHSFIHRETRLMPDSDEILYRPGTGNFLPQEYNNHLMVP